MTSSTNNITLDELDDRVHSLHRGSIILLLGDPDTGKSTLARRLIDRDLPVGLVDADVGQGSLAPPCAIGAALIDPRLPKGKTPSPPVSGGEPRNEAGGVSGRKK